LLGLLNHLQCDAILDTACRVKSLKLRENSHGRIGIDGVDFYKRGVANRIQYAVIHMVTLLLLYWLIILNTAEKVKKKDSDC
jgi:hypothetical protein